MVWSERRALQLVELYKQSKLLWHPKDPEHFTVKARRKAWIKIAEKMDCSPEDCKKKMSTLLACMRREKAKFRKSLRTGGPKKYKSNWFAFKSLQFMWDKDMDWKFPSPEHQENHIASCSKLEEDAPTYFAEADQYLSVNDQCSQEGSENDQKSVTSIKLDRSENCHRPVDQNLVRTGDALSVFGIFVGDSIRNLQNQRLQSWARHQISNILYIAEEAQFHRSAANEILNVSINPATVLSSLRTNSPTRDLDSGSPVVTEDLLSLSNPSSMASANEIYIKQEPL